MLGFNLVLLIVAAVLAIIAALLLWWRARTGQEIALMADTPTSTAAEAAKLAPGTLAEVKGTVRCAQLLTGEFSGKPCVYFRAEITREEAYYERDSNGRDQRRTRTTTIHSNVRHAPCVVEDASGRIAVDLDGAEVEAEEVVNQIEQPDTLTSLIGSIARFGSGGSDTYRRKESILAPDVPLYLLGEIRAGGTIGAPAKGSHNRKFVVSTKSEEQRTASLTSTTKWLLVIAILLFAAAAGVLYGAWSVGP